VVRVGRLLPGHERLCLSTRPPRGSPVPSRGRALRPDGAPPLGRSRRVRRRHRRLPGGVSLGHRPPRARTGRLRRHGRRRPLSSFVRPALGPLSFTPVASVALGPVTYLFSLNSVIGLGLAALVGLNLSMTYLAWTQPRACGLGQSSTGLLASLPAVLSGTACCGPVVPDRPRYPGVRGAPDRVPVPVTIRGPPARRGVSSWSADRSTRNARSSVPSLGPV